MLSAAIVGNIFGLLGIERLVNWSIVMVEHPIFGTKFRPFSAHGFT
jgi:hypothetical protein